MEATSGLTSLRLEPAESASQSPVVGGVAKGLITMIVTRL